MNINEIRRKLISDPIHTVPAWTVAAFDPTEGDLPRRNLHVARMGQYLNRLAEAGAKGVLLAASTGWGHARNFEEHRETLLKAGKIELDGCLKQALFRIEDPLDQNQALLKEVAELDYGIVWTRRGSELPETASDDEVAEHMLPLVKAAAEQGLPVGIYSISTVDGAPLTVGASKALLQKLGDLAKMVVAVKITEPDFVGSTLTYLKDEAFVDKKIVQGWDAFYADAMKAGMRSSDGVQQCGATSGAAACMVHAYAAMHQAAKDQEWERLATLQEVLSEVFYSMQGADPSKFPDLQIAKWVMGLGHPLTETRSENEAEPLLTKLQDLVEKPEKKEAAQLIVKSLLLMEGAVSTPLGTTLNKLL